MRLLDGFIPIFKYVDSLSIQLASSEQSSLDSLKQTFQHMLAVLDGEEFTSRYTDVQRESASFAVVALIDEKISETEWGHYTIGRLSRCKKYVFNPQCRNYFFNGWML